MRSVHLCSKILPPNTSSSIFRNEVSVQQPPTIIDELLLIQILFIRKLLAKRNRSAATHVHTYSFFFLMVE